MLVRDLRRPGILILAIFSAKREGEDFDCADIEVGKKKKQLGVIMYDTIEDSETKPTARHKRGVASRSATTQYHGSSKRRQLEYDKSG